MLSMFCSNTFLQLQLFCQQIHKLFLHFFLDIWIGACTICNRKIGQSRSNLKERRRRRAIAGAGRAGRRGGGERKVFVVVVEGFVELPVKSRSRNAKC